MGQNDPARPVWILIGNPTLWVFFYASEKQKLKTEAKHSRKKSGFSHSGNNAKCSQALTKQKYLVNLIPLWKLDVYYQNLLLLDLQIVEREREQRAERGGEARELQRAESWGRRARGRAAASEQGSFSSQQEGERTAAGEREIEQWPASGKESEWDWELSGE